jgi:TetR/AcrR family acrAB operon transcriptional repressor
MRRTKEAAARTRASIVDAALECFDRHGIAGSTLDQIAAAAGVTKGAIYHHFASKGEILHELRRHVSVPLLDEADTGLLNETRYAPLVRVERFLARFLETIASDVHTRDALTVMQFKCEYADELVRELLDMRRNNERLVTALEETYADAKRRGELAAGLEPRVAALETSVFVAGLIRLILLDRSRNGVRKNARELVRQHVRSRSRPA